MRVEPLQARYNLQGREVAIVNTFGHDKQLWKLAKDEARRILIERARAQRTIQYGELARKIQYIRFDPHGDHFRRFLGQLSREEDAAGRGMITAIVVHKRDERPGNGFFALAKELGRDVTDEVQCWVGEVQRVYKDFR